MDDRSYWRRLEKLATRITNPVYSPEGEYIYGVSGFGGNFALYKQQISPTTGDLVGEPLSIRDTGLAYIQQRLTISADGKKIAYNARSLNGNIISLKVSPASREPQGAPVPLTQGTSYRKAMPNFSPNGKAIAFTEFRAGEQPRIWVMNEGGGNANQLTDGSAVEWSPNWFPDNDTIAFQSNREDKERIWSISVSAGKRKLLIDPGQAIGWPRLSPDGKQFAFNSTKSETINVWTVAIDGGALRQLTFDTDAMGWPCWSPDGKLLALQIKRGPDTNIAIMPSSGGEITQLTFDHGSSQVHSWSPDGDKILFSGLRNGVWNIYWVSRSTRKEKQANPLHHAISLRSLSFVVATRESNRLRVYGERRYRLADGA